MILCSPLTYCDLVYFLVMADFLRRTSSEQNSVPNSSMIDPIGEIRAFALCLAFQSTNTFEEKEHANWLEGDPTGRL